MRSAAPGLVLLVLLALGACRGVDTPPGAAFDSLALDAVPAVPLQTETGIATGLLRPEGTLLTCSHALPRATPTGHARVAGRPVGYRAERSGDGLAANWGSPAQTPHPLNDWALLSLEPPLRPGDVFTAPVDPAPSPRPPTVGESLVLVGYTVESGRLVRFLVPVQVIDPPTSMHRSYGGRVAWLRCALSPGAAAAALPTPEGAGRPGAMMRRGFSGAPVLRREAGGEWSVCAIAVDFEYGPDDVPTDLALAIPIPATDPGTD